LAGRKLLLEAKRKFMGRIPDRGKEERRKRK
jgi:hypothetical protein